MKKISLIVTGLLIIAAVHPQSSNTTIQFNKSMQSALRLELASTTGDVKATVLEKLKQAGYKPQTEGYLFWKDNSIDGFYVFNNVLLPSLSTQKLDMYFKVIQKNKAEKDNSTLFLLVSTGNENFSSPEKDSTLWNNATGFLNGFIDQTVAYSLEQDIRRENNNVVNSEKKLSSLRQDEEELKNKIRKLQDELLHNQDNQAILEIDIQDQKKSLRGLESKRRQ